jgi:hypothetical protein
LEIRKIRRRLFLTVLECGEVLNICARDQNAHHDVIIIMMRTTLNIPDDVYEVVCSFAEDKKLSLGDAAAVLIRNGLNPSTRMQETTYFPMFSVAPEAAPITLKQTLAAEDEL